MLEKGTSLWGHPKDLSQGDALLEVTKTQNCEALTGGRIAAASHPSAWLLSIPPSLPKSHPGQLAGPGLGTENVVKRIPETH